MSLAAIVLAGGQSSRMGQDKALIPVQGVPLLRHVCDVAAECTNEIYVVTPWPQRYRELLPNSCRFVQERPLHQDIHPQGPLVGFAQGLAQVQTDWVLLLACDLPRLRGEVLQGWAQQLDTVPELAIAFVPYHAQGWDPLCGFYRRSCLPLLNAFISRGGRSFQRWLDHNEVQAIPDADKRMLFNCNTPNDLAALN
ncbi:molybdenum cofactor guanylyltransferase [Trichocoleus sp. FACHB-262]|uniref:molybdenum cofactor guanylyltransferase n=1 Tax=Trichocoleus sp. FACHB-262 TaxID=2692869 RepID=UPI00168970B7|nr:molybdenum cofactor guanylyltransferase [Trichocoleus sp. FACHB-262]MBD2122557.1 molybdenum cofactor guanylyltransferase [Trichocoleus sp. FACHB-262]